MRSDGPILDPAWTVEEVSLEDIVLAYMGTPARRVAARHELEVLS